MRQLSALLLTLVVITPNAPLFALKTGTTIEFGDPTSKTAVPFKQAVFVPQQQALFLSSAANFTQAPLDNAEEKTYALAVATLDPTTGDIVMTPFAPATPTIDGTDDTSTPFNTAAGVTGIAVSADGTQIAAFINGRMADPAVGADSDESQSVYQITSSSNTSLGDIISTSGELKDADDKALGNDHIYAVAVAQGVVNAGGNDLIFAAVSSQDNEWGANDATPETGHGIAILGAAATASGIRQRDAKAVQTAVDQNKSALAIDLIAVDANHDWSKNLAIGINQGNGSMKNAEILANAASLHWSDKMQRLFVGANVGGQNEENTGGVVAVGSVSINDKGEASFQSIIAKDLTTTKFTDLIPQYILNDDQTKLGTNADCVVAISSSNDICNKTGMHAQSLHTMATSTNKDYLIVKSEATGNYDENNSNLLFHTLAALPLTLNGVIAAVVDSNVAEPSFTTIPKTADTFPRALKPAIKIAPNISNPENISDVFVDGDSVYFSLNNSTNKEPAHRGMFRSTALFNENGAIVAWTPGERVGGDLGAVHGCGYDAASNTLVSLGSADTGKGDLNASPINTVRVSNWSKDSAANSLNTALAPYFPAASGGIHSMASFNEATPGFAGATNAATAYDKSEFSMMAAVGKDNIVLIQAGLGDENANFIPTPDFAAEHMLAPFTALKSVAPFSCVELSRSLVANTTYVFAGGYKGLAVAASADTGAGANEVGSLADLEDLTNAFQLQPTNPAHSFKNVRKVVAAANSPVVFVMTNKEVYGFCVTDGAGNAAPDKFNGPGEALLESLVTFADLPEGASLNDLVVVSNVAANTRPDAATTLTLILATSKGVYHAQVNPGGNGINFAAGADVEATGVTPVSNDSDTTAGMPALQLNYVSPSRAANVPRGNMFVLYGDLSQNQNSGIVKRYVVNPLLAAANRVQLVNGSILADGTIDADVESEHLNVNTFTLSDIRGGFALAGNTIFQSRTFDVEYGASAVAGLVMNSAIDNSGTRDAEGNLVDGPLGADLYVTDLNALIDDTIKYLAAPAVDPATGNVMIPHQKGLIINS